jgi:hypothetical protein
MSLRSMNMDMLSASKTALLEKGVMESKLRLINTIDEKTAALADRLHSKDHELKQMKQDKSIMGDALSHIQLDLGRLNAACLKLCVHTCFMVLMRTGSRDTSMQSIRASWRSSIDP